VRPEVPRLGRNATTIRSVYDLVGCRMDSRMLVWGLAHANDDS
jgi:hypothetical protein